MTEEKKYFTYIDTVTGNKDMEKIIIDGVNVAKCKYYHYKGCTANNFGKCDSCSEIYKNCYYKQLQCLKQENEKLRKATEISVDKINVSVNAKVYYKMKKALEEIKEIAKFHQYFNPEFLEIKGDIGQLQDLKMTEIYEKCNEVLGND